MKELRSLLSDDQVRNYVESADEVTSLYLPPGYKPLWIPTKSLHYKHALRYLTNRGIKGYDIIRYQMGYTIDGPYANRIIIPSYDKIMITDFAMSLSRKRKDKVDGTGRFHIMKNRYGGDGMTFAAKIDTTTGHIDINSQELDEDDMEMMAQNSKADKAGFDNYDKKQLAKKFFELSNQ